MNEKIKDFLIAIIVILVFVVPLILGVAVSIVELYITVKLVKLLRPLWVLLIVGVIIFLIYASCTKDK